MHTEQIPSLSEKEEKQAFFSCQRFLNQHPKQSPRQALEELARACAPSELPDFYGEGEIIADFEREIADLLGKESAVFMPSGTMAQPIALKIWCDRGQNKNFGMHPTSHLENHEHLAYRHLHGLSAHLLGQKDRTLSPQDLHDLEAELAALLLELPHRDLGGTLPEWSELLEMSAWCRDHNTRFHLDGARLWESGPFYDKEYREICALFDSVYVSFYKGLGGIAGAALAGSKEFIHEARIWQRRQGGNLISLYPYVISARAALKLRLSRMRSYYERALEIFEILKRFPEFEVLPARPQTNMMHLILKKGVDFDKLEKAFLKTALEQKIALFRKVQRLENGNGRLELIVGDGTLELSLREIEGLFEGIRTILDSPRTHAKIQRI